MMIPPDIDLKPYSKINSLSRDAKKNYYLNLLRKVLKANPDGLTPTAISNALNQLNLRYSYNHDTLRVYLNQLVAMRESYPSAVGNAVVYKYNGRLLHGDKKNFLEEGSRAYQLIEVENPSIGQRFFIIQEKERNAYNIERVVGGVMVSKKDIHEFMAALDAAIRKEAD